MDTPLEIARLSEIPGYEPFGRYVISSRGEIWSDISRRVLQSPPGKGKRRVYRTVDLYGEGERRSAAVHRLVCEAFHGPAPGPGYDAAHLDHDPANCAAVNLAWTTHAENVRASQ